VKCSDHSELPKHSSSIIKGWEAAPEEKILNSTTRGGGEKVLKPGRRTNGQEGRRALLKSEGEYTSESAILKGGKRDENGF